MHSSRNLKPSPGSAPNSTKIALHGPDLKSTVRGDRDGLELLRFCDRPRERLLDKKVATGLEHLSAEREVQPVGYREDHRVDRVVSEELIERPVARDIATASDLAGERFRAVADGHELGAISLRQGRHVRSLGDPSGADQTDPDVRHRVILRAVFLQASLRVPARRRVGWLRRAHRIDKGCSFVR
jgi:hypothetical protein